MSPIYIKLTVLQSNLLNEVLGDSAGFNYIVRLRAAAAAAAAVIGKPILNGRKPQPAEQFLEQLIPRLRTHCLQGRHQRQQP
jgi:hypothetical protein